MSHKPQSRVLKHFLDLSPTEPQDSDVIFIAIDFENGRNMMNNFHSGLNFQVGISILDTRDLRDLSSSPDSIIKTYNFIAGSANYCANKAQPYCFGASTIISPHDLISSIEPLFSRDRNLVLVGHDIKNELEVLQKFGFDLDTSFACYLDTQVIFAEQFGLQSHYGLNLRFLLQALGCTSGISDWMFHTAGNDANFTLRILLLLAVDDIWLTIFANDDTSRIPYMLWTIAQSPIPNFWMPPIFSTHKAYPGFDRVRQMSLMPIIPQPTNETKPKVNEREATPQGLVEIKCKGANWEGYFVVTGTAKTTPELTIRPIRNSEAGYGYTKIERQPTAELRQRHLAKNKDILTSIPGSKVERSSRGRNVVRPRSQVLRSQDLVRQLVRAQCNSSLHVGS